MYFKFGNHQHDDNEVTLSAFTQVTVRNRRGKPQFIKKRMTLDGVLLPTSATQAQIKSKIAELEAAYETEGKNAGLYHDDGTVSAHYLDNNSSVTGVRIVSKDFPEGDGAEYATQRTFQIVLEADYLADSYENLVAFQESLDFAGNCGPAIVWKYTANSLPQQQIVHQRTTQIVTQTGGAIGYLSYPSAPAPMFGGLEHGPRRRVTRDGPTLEGNQFVNHGIRWQYVFESAQPLFANPNKN